MSASLSARVNVAYATLREAQSRAIYLMQLQGQEWAEEARETDPQLLMEVMALREELDGLEWEGQQQQQQQGAGGLDGGERSARLQRLQSTVSQRLSRIDGSLAAAFAASDWRRVQRLIGELVYFTNIHQHTQRLAPVPP